MQPNGSTKCSHVVHRILFIKKSFYRKLLKTFEQCLFSPFLVTIYFMRALKCLGDIQLNWESIASSESDINIVSQMQYFSFSHCMRTLHSCVVDKTRFEKEDHEKISNRRVFKSIIEAVFSCLFELGDSVLVLKLLQKRVLEEMVCLL